MRNTFLFFWKLSGCVLLVAALFMGVRFHSLSRQGGRADAEMRGGDFAEGISAAAEDERGAGESLRDEDLSADGERTSGYGNSQGSGQYNGDIVLETEYDIKDYCNGCFVVSKNDDLLYGLLDIHGNEILPVQYDDVNFCNADNVINGINENLYIVTKYEDQQNVWDSRGNLIFDTYAYVIDFKYGKPDADTAFWEEKDSDNKVCRIYAEDKTLLQEIDYSNHFYLQMTWLSPDNYFAAIQKSNTAPSSVTYLYDKNANIKKQWDNANLLNFKASASQEYYFYIVDADGVYEKYSVSDGGEAVLLKTMDRDGATEEIASDSRSETTTDAKLLGKDKNIRLYRSNGTVKLEDENGNPLYEERYYEGYYEDNCYILVNEDNQACLINQNGRMVIDYGWLDVENDNIRFLGKRLYPDSILNGGEEVGIVVNEDGISKVYMFSEAAG